jgi:hypothetical protein
MGTTILLKLLNTMVTFTPGAGEAVSHGVGETVRIWSVRERS